MPWERAVTVSAVILVALVAARVVDRRMARRQLAPEAATRYRVLRRSIAAGIVTVGVLSALLTIPQVRVVAGGILASTAVVGLVVGLAAQRTLSNFISGILIAFAQPLRIGDRVSVDGEPGVVEEIGLTYTFIRTDDGSRLVTPNEKLASDTIRNSTIVSRQKVSEVTVQVPITQELGTVVELLREETSAVPGADVFVSALDATTATITLRVPADDPDDAERLQRELRLRAHARLKAEGVFA
jgi:small-conductance mechanosensitive channel